MFNGIDDGEHIGLVGQHLSRAVWISGVFWDQITIARPMMCCAPSAMRAVAVPSRVFFEYVNNRLPGPVSFTTGRGVSALESGQRPVRARTPRRNTGSFRGSVPRDERQQRQAREGLGAPEGSGLRDGSRGPARINPAANLPPDLIAWCRAAAAAAA